MTFTSKRDAGAKGEMRVRVVSQQSIRPWQEESPGRHALRARRGGRETTRSSSSSLVLSLQPRARQGVIASRWKPGGYPRAALISFLEEEYIPAVRAFRAALSADEREMTIYLCMDN